MKKVIGLLIAVFVVSFLVGFFRGGEKIYVVGEKLVILEEFTGKDWQGEESWGFITSVDGEKKEYFAYPGVFQALIYDSIVEINVAEIDDQFGGKSDKMSIEALGKTKEGVYLFYAYNLEKHISHLVFVEFEKNQGVSLSDLLNGSKQSFYEDQVLIRKVGEITLGEGFYEFDKNEIEKNKLTVGESTYDLVLTPPSKTVLVTRKLPFRLDSKPFVSPIIIESFVQSMRTGDSSIVALDLVEAQKNPVYGFLGCGYSNNTEKYCQYSYEGMLKNGIHIVSASNFSPHPATVRHLFVVYEKDYSLNVDWEKKTITRNKRRVLLKKLGELDLYYLGDSFTLKDNIISYSTGHWDNKPFAATDEIEFTEHVMKVDMKIANID